MAEESILTDEFLRQLIDVGEADVLVGVPTYNNAATVGQVVQTIRAGLLKYFPRERAVIVNADGGSRDQTWELVRGASINDLQHSTDLNALRTLHSISAEYAGGPATGTALRTILASAELLRVSACAVVSPESTTIEPEWIERLLRPVYQGNFDFVTPLYRRHKFDGLLMRNLVYPMTRAFYGKRVREPYAAEFSFSGPLASHFLGQEIWTHEVGQTGTEIALTISAITGGFRLAQSFLGVKPHVDARAADLVDGHAPDCRCLVLVTRAELFSLECEIRLAGYPYSWRGAGSNARAAEGKPQTAFRHVPLRSCRTGACPQIDSFATHARRTAKNIRARRRRFCFMATNSGRAPSTNSPLRITRLIISRDHIVQALAPLYRGRAFTFLVENREASGEQVEQNVEDFCMTCERLKPSLVEMWNGRK